MKKILLLIIALLSITSTSNASFWSISSLDLYKNIDQWIDSLQDKMTTFELEWWQEQKWILVEINKLAVINESIACLDESKEISVEEFKKIVNEENISELMKYINDECAIKYFVDLWLGYDDLKDGNYKIATLIKYIELFKLYKANAEAKSEIKTEQIYKISQVWLYADWNIENSWFDLITDIEEIDKIIFADVIDYEWEQIDSVDEVLNDFFEPLNNKINELTEPSPLIDNENPEDNTPIDYIPTNKVNDWENIINTDNSYVCPNDLNNSWLSNQALNWLLNNIENNINWNWELNTNQNNNIVLSWSNNINNTDDWLYQNPNWAYEKVTDNSEWPCETFFCITIDFTTYEHSLFWWWENITIEYLLNRSNKHLSKAAATSLIPAKMWTNEFELWLKDLNLPDVFHLSFQISTKPIPILNIEKQWKEDETELSAKSLLEEYYKINWLDYKKRNNLDALEKLEQDKQNINNASWLSIDELLKKQKENDSIVRERQKKADIIRKTIDSKVSYWVMSTFEEQFTELDKFTLSINDYILNLNSLIKQLRKIPIEY